MGTNVLIFDGPYNQDKQAEGVGVNWAFCSGACNYCPYLPRCESDNEFVFPADAACTIKKNEVLKKWKEGSK